MIEHFEDPGDLHLSAGHGKSAENMKIVKKKASKNIVNQGSQVGQDALLTPKQLKEESLVICRPKEDDIFSDFASEAPTTNKIEACLELNNEARNIDSQLS